MKILSPILLRGGAVLLFVVTVLAACTVVEEDYDRPGRPGPMCTREYDPVCGRRGGVQQTFANGCLADEAGFRVVRRGECRRDDGPRGCTREYDPVCGRRGGDQQTFSNSCLADEAGYRVVRRGECRRDDGGSGGNDEPRVCTTQYDPVCARRGGTEQTFANSCTAEQAGYRVVRNGECRAPDSATDRYCTREYAPVCGRKDSQMRTFPNSCEAEVSGFRIVSQGPC